MQQRPVTIDTRVVAMSPEDEVRLAAALRDLIEVLIEQEIEKECRREETALAGGDKGLPVRVHQTLGA